MPRQAARSITGAGHALWNVGWRYLLSRRWQSLLMILGITLGVAVVISIDYANASASRAFELSTQTITGRTTHHITGGPKGVEEDLFARLKREGVASLAAPVINEYVVSPELGGHPMQLLGIDPLSDAPFRSFLGGQTVEESSIPSGPDFAALTVFLTRPGAVMISQPLAERYGLVSGDEITIRVRGKNVPAFIAGLLQPANSLSLRTMEGVILADIATAQEMTGTTGYLTQIDLILPENDSQAVQRLSDWLPQGYRVQTAEARSGTIQEMAAAFQVNLSALSLLALVVGLFLIYNTMTFSVVQRRSLFGTLRCLGVTRVEIFRLVLGEAFLVGLAGGLLGIGLGLLLGQVTVRMVTQTINDLYFTTTVQSIGVDPLSLLKGSGLGLLASVLTAAIPAWEAASVPPRAALLRSGLESKARRSIGWTVIAGILALALGGAIFALPYNSLLLGFSGTLVVVVGFALLSSASMVGLMRAIVPVTSRLFGFIGRMAPRNLTNALSRTAVAVAALMVAVAVIIGVALMIDSFRYTVIVWLEQTLQGDVYISAPMLTANRSSVEIDPQVVKALQEWPGVAQVDLLRSTVVDSPSGRVVLAGTENPNLGSERIFAKLQGSPEDVWQMLQAGGVIISEPLANRFGIVDVGSEIEFYTKHGWKSYPVVGIYYDYASSEGAAMMALDIYRRDWLDDALTAITLQLAPGVNADQVARALQDELQTEQELVIRPNQALRRDIMDIFDRTFAITVALRLLATVVAFIGVLNALLLLQLEKQREVGILRALGLTGRQLWKLVMVETGLMGLVAGLLAIPTGYTLALILVFIINRRSFGWTLQMSIQPETFIQSLLIALVAALLAGLYPALKMSRMAAAEVIRNE